MNAAIRATARAAIYYDLHIYGFMNGYEGLIDGKLKRLEKGDGQHYTERWDYFKKPVVSVYDT